MSRSQTTLTKMEDFALMSFMKERLESSGLQAKEFAELARVELNNPKINKDHLYYRAKELGLKIAEKRGPVDNSVLGRRIEDLANDFGNLEERVLELEKMVDILKLAAKHNKS